MEQAKSRPNEVWEITEYVDAFIEVRDSSCILEITATNLFTKEKHLLNPLVLPLSRQGRCMTLWGSFWCASRCMTRNFEILRSDREGVRDKPSSGLRPTAVCCKVLRQWLLRIHTAHHRHAGHICGVATDQGLQSLDKHARPAVALRGLICCHGSGLLIRREKK